MRIYFKKYIHMYTCTRNAQKHTNEQTRTKQTPTQTQTRNTQETHKCRQKTHKTNVVPSKNAFVCPTASCLPKKAFCILKQTCPIFVTLFFGSTKSKFPSQDVFCSFLCVFINEYRHSFPCRFHARDHRQKIENICICGTVFIRWISNVVE